MARVAEAPGMGVAMSIDHEQIRPPLDTLECPEQRRCLTERKKAGCVRKGDGGLDGDLLDDLQRRERQHDNCSSGTAGRLVEGGVPWCPEAEARIWRTG